MRSIDMTVDEALSFLSDHQPMPSDEQLTQNLIDKYDEVRKFFISRPDNRAIKLFLLSYGEGDGWGVYQLVEDFFYRCNDNDVKHELKEVLENKTIPNSVRYWSTQMAAAFSDEKLRKGLEVSLQSENSDIKYAAEMALDILNEQT